MSAELAARRTAAAAAVGDFRREERRGDRAFDYEAWALRLASELASLLERLADERPALAPQQREVLGQILDDAIAYRESMLGGTCTGCEIHPAGLCQDHAADLDRTDAYIALGRQLGIEADRD